MRDTKGDNKQQQINIKIEEMVGVLYPIYSFLKKKLNNTNKKKNKN